MTPYALEMRRLMAAWLPRTLPKHGYIVDPFVGVFAVNGASQPPSLGVLLRIPVQRFHDAWMLTRQGESFLTGNCDGCNVVKLIAVARFLAEPREGVWAPTLSLDYGGNSFSVAQGRHRIMFHLIAGYDDIEVAVNPLHAERFEALFLSSDSKSLVTRAV